MNTRNITYLSPPTAVNVANAWFDVSSLSHFWVKRRVEVLRHMMVQVPMTKGRAAEIGCGNGFVQVQLEDVLGAPVDGCDLNEEALRRNKANLGICIITMTTSAMTPLEGDITQYFYSM